MKPVRALESWFARSARALPWRRTRDPYAVWISEVMLQQTQVATVIPYWHRFLERFPDLGALAAAEEPAVLAAWSGLGYYSRARNLHRAAKYLVAECGGAFPRDREALLAVPGIGPYTAGAILSIAFDLPVPLVDGNVQRVFSRYFAYGEKIETTAARDFFWARAADWVAAARSPRALNQALMELGAVVCVKGEPRCGTCPLERSCEARRQGLQAELPRRKERRATVDLFWVGLVIEAEGHVYLKRNVAGEWWADLWDCPKLDARSPAGATRAANAAARGLPGVLAWDVLGARRHTVTHHRLHVVPCHARLEKRTAAPVDGAAGEWFPLRKVPALPLSSLARKILAPVLQ